MQISVAMCAYNGERYLREQLDSIGAQTVRPFELIVCDDGSADRSVEIIEAFATRAQFPVQVHRNNTNLGSTRSFERAIGLCTGEVIVLSDQDDVWLPTKLARLQLEFSRSPEVGLVFTDADVVNDQLQPEGYSLWEKLGLGPEERERLRQGRGFDSLLQGATVTGATSAFRSRFKCLALPFPDDISLIHDAWIAVLIAAVAQIVPVSERLVKYRQHSGQQVGALKRRDGRDWGEPRGALRRLNPYSEMLATTRTVRRRLVDRLGEFDSRMVLPGLEAKITHLTTRSDMPRKRLRRAPGVMRELLSCRYHRYSNGFRSAVKDLLA